MWPGRSVVDSLSSGYPTAPTVAPDWHNVGIKQIRFDPLKPGVALSDHRVEIVARRPEVPKKCLRGPVRKRRVQEHRRTEEKQTPLEVRLKLFRNETEKQNSVLKKALRKLKTDKTILKQVKKGKNTHVDTFNRVCNSRPLLRQGKNYLEHTKPPEKKKTEKLVPTTPSVATSQKEEAIISPYASFVLKDEIDSGLRMDSNEKNIPRRKKKKAALREAAAAFDGPWESQDAVPDTNDLNFERSHNASSASTLKTDVSSDAGIDEPNNPPKFYNDEHRYIDTQYHTSVGPTLAEHKIDLAIEKQTHEWGQYCTRIFQQKLQSQTRGFQASIGRLKREHDRSKQWVLRYFQLGIKDLLDELLELKAASFIDPRKTRDLIKRYGKVIENRRERIAPLQQKLEYMQERYKIEMHIVNAKISSMTTKMNDAAQDERAVRDALFKTNKKYDENQRRLRQERSAIADKEAMVVEKEQKLKRLQCTLEQLRTKAGVVLDPQLILKVDEASQGWAKVQKLLDGVMHDLGCPFCFTPMRLPQTVEISALGGTITMCSHCVVEKSSMMTQKEKTFPQLDHNRAANIVAQFGDGDYSKKKNGAEALVEELEKSVGIVRGGWEKVKRRMSLKKRKSSPAVECPPE